MTAISHSHLTQAIPTNAKRFEDKRTFVNFQSDISKLSSRTSIYRQTNISCRQRGMTKSLQLVTLIIHILIYALPSGYYKFRGTLNIPLSGYTFVYPNVNIYLKSSILNFGYLSHTRCACDYSA